jgi:tRNA A-37 threonylcarbamoyl transferase component Bud32
MSSEKRVSTLKPGDVFRDWLVDVIGDRIHNKKCNVAVYKFRPASHTVCRYEFEGEEYSVVAKFYAEPTGWRRHYNPVRSLEREYEILKNVEQIIDIPRPIAMRRRFNCALVTEYIDGSSLYRYIKTEDGLYDRLTAVAHTLRRLHDQTRSDYRKEQEFARFHKILDQLRLDPSTRMNYNRLLGEWWYSPLIDQSYGCRIHNDATPVNYLFNHRKLYAIDFESSWEHANMVHDLGIVAAELKCYFTMHRKDGQKAEPYIGHFLWHYSQNEAEFRRITQAIPFFMSLGLLRMARLGLGQRHRAFVFDEARACLEAVRAH